MMLDPNKADPRAAMRQRARAIKAAGGLSAAIEKGALPKHALHNLIAAREFDLYDDPMPTLSDLEGYLGETSSSLIQMAADFGQRRCGSGWSCWCSLRLGRRSAIAKVSLSASRHGSDSR